jgi:hypothetical protein
MGATKASRLCWGWCILEVGVRTHYAQRMAPQNVDTPISLVVIVIPHVIEGDPAIANAQKMSARTQ